jgi:hypothetical protein
MPEGKPSWLGAFWRNAYDKQPIITFFATIIIMLGIVVILAIPTIRQESAEEEAKRLQLQNYGSRIVFLDQMKNNLRDLIQFIDWQEKQLRQSESTLAILKSEHEKLKPLLDADRKTIDALFVAQESRNKKAQSRERWIGFGLGILASLLASPVFAFVTKFLKRRRETKPVPWRNRRDRE